MSSRLFLTVTLLHAAYVLLVWLVGPFLKDGTGLVFTMVVADLPWTWAFFLIADRVADALQSADLPRLDILNASIMLQHLILGSLWWGLFVVGLRKGIYAWDVALRARLG